VTSAHPYANPNRNPSEYANAQCDYGPLSVATACALLSVLSVVADIIIKACVCALVTKLSFSGVSRIMVEKRHEWSWICGVVGYRVLGARAAL